MNYYIGVDLGTSALKLLLLDNSGEILKTVSKSYDVDYPKSGWSQQNPEDWWTALKSGIKELLSEVDASKVAGIGAGGQMHGLVILDENDKVIRPAILWNDGRTDKETAYLNEVVGKEKLSELTANIAFAGFTAPKLLWLKNNEPENFSKISKIMLPKDYINYKLTGVHSTDYSDASGMLLLDVKNKRWSEFMLDVCSVSKQQMPSLYESYQTVGTVLPEIANEFNISENVKVVAGAGDNAAAAVGTGTVADGKCNISLGTSGTVFISSDKFSVDDKNALHSFCHANSRYHLMACILSAASCNKWFCDEILKTSDYAEEQIGITDDKLGNNDVFFLPYLMGERSPINDTDARGTFIGMRMDTSRADMVQAVLEGVAFAIRDNLEIAKALGINIESSGLCGGGAKSPLWRKILCNVLNVKISIPQTEQGPGYGGAMLAMVGTGEYETVNECAEKFVKIKTTVTPQQEIVERYENKYQKFKEIYPSVKELFKKIK
ncbi:MAG: xylulokinase [Acutalibacteraceae bacterium]|nr:xylulokinase [Acutalibacteraceae bacterium]